jgi:nicotinic acid phosphoribosyltransferase
VGAVGGGVLAGTFSASAATSDASGYSSTTSGTTRGGFPAHGTAAHEALEKPVTGTNATKAQAAAIKQVGSGKAGAVTTDVSGNGYEVTVTKADGSKVEVHLTSSFGLDDHSRNGD